MVEIFQGVEPEATHPRCQHAGKWQIRLEDYPPHKADNLRRTPDYCRQQALRLGPATHQVVETLLNDRPWYRLRSVQVILRLEEIGVSKKS
jgi:hypothetical protein